MFVRNRAWFNCAALSAALLVSGCTGTAAPTKDIGTDIDQVAATLIEQPLLHSTSIAVVYRGEEIIRHRGAMETSKPGPPTDATLYEIGSLSKTLAGTLMANAVLERRLSLDDDIRMYLQGDYPNLQYKDEPIRVRHLLSHTSGLPNMLPERTNTVLAIGQHEVVHTADLCPRVPQTSGDAGSQHSHDDQVLVRHKILARQHLDGVVLEMVVGIKERGLSWFARAGLELFNRAVALADWPPRRGPTDPGTPAAVTLRTHRKCARRHALVERGACGSGNIHGFKGARQSRTACKGMD